MGRAGSKLNGCAQENSADGTDAQGAQLSSVRGASFDIIGGLVFLTFGGLLLGFPSEKYVEAFADKIEGWLIGRSRKPAQGPALLGLSLFGMGVSVVVLISESEGACIVEELHRALGALESQREGDPRDDGDEDEPGTRFVSVPPARDTEPHPGPAPDPDELELRGAGGLVTSAEVWS